MRIGASPSKHANGDLLRGDPPLSYSISIWKRATLNKTNRTELERVQAMALRIMTGPYRAPLLCFRRHYQQTIHHQSSAGFPVNDCSASGTLMLNITMIILLSRCL